MSQPGDADLLVLARRVLLDALEALVDQRDALILVGAQAIYVHTKATPVGIPESTKDSDIAVDRRQLGADPLLEQAMTRAGFEPTGQPGRWLGAMGVPVDLMIPRSMSDPGGSRGGRLPPHSERSTRQATGLEAAMVDYSVTRITALEEGDDREFSLKVAGPGALLVAKMHKLGDRQGDDNRLNNKDAHDVYRLLATVPTEVFVDSLARLRDDELAGDATRSGLRYFDEMFAAGPDAIGCVLAGRAEEMLGDPAFVPPAAAALAQDLASALSSS